MCHTRWQAWLKAFCPVLISLAQRITTLASLSPTFASDPPAIPTSAPTPNYIYKCH